MFASPFIYGDNAVNTCKNFFDAVFAKCTKGDGGLKTQGGYATTDPWNFRWRISPVRTLYLLIFVFLDGRG
jgi:hypothetical protein